MAAGGLLPDGAPRVALGAMRLSTEEGRDDAAALAVLAAGLDAGVALVDTARAYALGDEDLGENERLVARALAGRAAPAAVITKGGMARPGGRWAPDGRARTLRADAEASLAALGAPPALWLLHAPDPETPWATSLRALAGIAADGLAVRVGVSNVTLRQLDEALDAAPVAAVEVALGVAGVQALRGGVVARALERGLTVLAHAPLGGPARAARHARHPELARVAERLGTTPAALLVAGLVDLHPGLVPVVGVRRVETARQLAAAARLAAALDDEARAVVHERLGFGPEELRPPRARPAPPPRADAGEVVLVMGVPGAGKTTLVADWVARGYQRLNRDERGGTLRGLAAELERLLAAGATRVVLDNTFLDRAARHAFLAAAARAGLPVRGVWIDVAPEVSARRVVARMLDAHGRLLEPDELRRGKDPTALPPGALLRARRTAEPPAADEGFAALETVAAAPERPRGAHAGRLVALEVAEAAPASLAPETPEIRVLVWAFSAAPRAELDALAARLSAARGAPVDVLACPHGGGPPVCWCRPPLPGLPLAWARARDVDLARSVVVGASATARALAAAIGAASRPP